MFVGDRLYRVSLLRYAGLCPMKFEEQRGGHFMIQFRVPVDCCHLRFVEQLDLSHGDTVLDRQDTVLTAFSMLGNAQTAAETASGIP